MDNRVTVDRDGNIHQAKTYHNAEPHRWLLAELNDLLGADPKQSALDIDCKAHDLDNLYVVDTSSFPSSSAVNPSLTAIANALRVGDPLIQRLGVPAAASSVA